MGKSKKPSRKNDIQKEKSNLQPENDAWSALAALQHVLNVLFQLEQKETNPDVLCDLSAVSIEVNNELEEILGILEEKVED
ncbi:MAG TPA: hypothetical protein VKK79_17260 [Candidatus Lokiarchaeia archaeon]|nr:hypothetical protein [Candidatus Lokiarchaeia archaeon]